MSYAQRTALVEPLAKASQLKVIVATTGLAAGINFAMRSVLYSTANTVWPKTAPTPRRATADVRPCWPPRPRRAAPFFTGKTPRLIEAKPLRLQREIMSTGHP